MLPVEAPVPVAQGWPSDQYPWFWEVHTWVEGETVIQLHGTGPWSLKYLDPKDDPRNQKE